MGRLIYSFNEIDNAGTLYEEVIAIMYAEELWNEMLINTKFLRNNILKTIKEFIDHEKTICIKEFSDAPPMIYDDPEKFEYGLYEIATDFIVVKDAFGMDKIDEANDNFDEKYSLVVESLHKNGVTVEKWDNYLDEIFLKYSGEDLHKPRVGKIVVEDVISYLQKWENISDIITKDMIKEYNAAHEVSHDITTFWQEPLNTISKNYWEKFSFILTINDYEIYDETKQKYLDVIAERYFNQGYFDEVVIKINYFYWHDNFQKIVDWSQKNLRSALVSYRVDTLFSNADKNRYFDDEEATLYGDVQRQNSIAEELVMFEERMPVLLEKILTNPQTFGFELVGGYFGQEGNIPTITLGYEEFLKYKPIMCKTLAFSPFAQVNDMFKIIFTDGLKHVFICVRANVD